MIVKLQTSRRFVSSSNRDPPQRIQDGQVELVDEVEWFPSRLVDQTLEHLHLLLDHLLHPLLAKAKISQSSESKSSLFHPRLPFTD